MINYRSFIIKNVNGFSLIIKLTILNRQNGKFVKKGGGWVYTHALPLLDETGHCTA